MTLYQKREVNALFICKLPKIKVIKEKIGSRFDTTEERYGVEIMQIAFDKYNAMATMQSLESEGKECVIVRQHSDTLHMPTKLLKEAVLGKKFVYDENQLLEINFENARCVFDNNMNRYVNKKRSVGKVDMVVSLINAIFLAQQEILYGSDFIVC